MEQHETFLDLLKDPAHWQFEVFLIILFDIIIGAILWPKFRRWFTHHKRDDEILHELEERVRRLEERSK